MQGGVWSGVAWLGKAGLVGRGEAWHGVGVARLGEAWRGWSSTAWRGWRGELGRGEAGSGRVRHGAVRRDVAWWGWAGAAWCGGAGSVEAWLGEAG
jgi:hypothetical protein